MPCHISKFRNVKTLMSVTPIHILSLLKIVCIGLTNWVGMLMLTSPPFCNTYAQKLPLLFIRLTVHELSSIMFFYRLSHHGKYWNNLSSLTFRMCLLWMLLSPHIQSQSKLAILMRLMKYLTGFLTEKVTCHHCSLKVRASQNKDRYSVSTHI